MTVTEHPATTAFATTIHPAELRQLLHDDRDARVIDVRTGSEFESVHIPGSFNVPLDLLGEHVRALADLDHPVVLVCQSGGRASTAQGRLQHAGKHNLRVLEGGITSWIAFDGDVVRGRERWSLERQVRLVAGSIVASSILASLRWPGARFVAGAIGAGLTGAALTNTCAMGAVLSKLPYNRGPGCDLDRVLRDLQR